MRHSRGRGAVAALLLGILGSDGAALRAQIVGDDEVRQLVTFRFLPGNTDEAIRLFRERALPLYERDEAMLSFRGFREAESPVPLDLMVVSAFRGMSGMDDSNHELRGLAEQAGTSIGALYGDIAALSASHDDQFFQMLTAHANGDPATKPIFAVVWYRAAPGQVRVLLRRLEQDVLAFERSEGIPSSTGRSLISDGWDYVRFIGFESLGEYQEHRSRISDRVNDYVAVHREMILAPVPGLTVR